VENGVPTEHSILGSLKTLKAKPNKGRINPKSIGKKKSLDDFFHVMANL